MDATDADDAAAAMVAMIFAAGIFGVVTRKDAHACNDADPCMLPTPTLMTQREPACIHNADLHVACVVYSHGVTLLYSVLCITVPEYCIACRTQSFVNSINVCILFHFICVASIHLFACTSIRMRVLI